MTLLNRSTRRRLNKLRQVPSIWEGDRYSLSANGSHESFGNGPSGDCILWVDGSAATVRAMEMVPHEAAQEAVVRVLLRAMEHPNGQVDPARPQKIVVRNRELQFFLRGVLQDLGITVEYAEELPLIDDIFHGLQTFMAGHQPRLPAQYAEALQEAAIAIWNDAPWQQLDEEKIIEICLNYQEVDSLYLSFLGMLGVEFGVLMYRSKDSLKAFRQQVLSLDESSQELLEEAFLQQDCLFLTFESDLPEIGERPVQPKRGSQNSGVVPLHAVKKQPAVIPEFGNLHPLEGMRPTLYEEDALVVLVSLQALHRFLQTYQDSLHTENFPSLSQQYQISDPEISDPEINDPEISDPEINDPEISDPEINDPHDPSDSDRDHLSEAERSVAAAATKTLTVTVSTLPELADELATMVDESIGEDGVGFEDFAVPIIDPEMVPPGTISQVGRLPWETLEKLRHSATVYQQSEQAFECVGDGFPIVLLQTSRPKAMKLIEAIERAGGLRSLGFIPGEDQFGSRSYDLGVLQTRDRVFHIFTEYDGDDHTHIQAREKWDNRCQSTQGHCGLIIAKGGTGAARGNPSLKDMVGLFEVRSLDLTELGMGTLRLIPTLGLD